MDEPRNVPFGELGWADDAPGIEPGKRRWGASVGPPSSTGKGFTGKNGARKDTAGTSSRARSSTSSMMAANP